MELTDSNIVSYQTSKNGTPYKIYWKPTRDNESAPVYIKLDESDKFIPTHEWANSVAKAEQVGIAFFDPESNI